MNNKSQNRKKRHQTSFKKGRRRRFENANFQVTQASAPHPVFQERRYLHEMETVFNLRAVVETYSARLPRPDQDDWCMEAWAAEARV